MKSKKFTAIFLISILFLVSVIAVLWIKNNKLKKELDEYSTYKRIFVSFNGVVSPIAPVKAEDINKPLYFERHIDGTVLRFPIENSAGLKDGGKLFSLGKYMFFQGNSGKLQHYVQLSEDFRRYPHIWNFNEPVLPGEYFVKFGLYGLTTDFKQLSPKENGIRLTFNKIEEPQASIEKRQISETLQKFLRAVQIPDYLKHGKADFDALEHQAESLRLVTLKFNYGADTLDSVLDEELRLLDILMADKSLIGRENELLIKEYWTRLNRLCRIKEAQWKAGALLLKDLKSYQKAVSDFQKAHNIK